MVCDKRKLPQLLSALTNADPHLEWNHQVLPPWISGSQASMLRCKKKIQSSFSNAGNQCEVEQSRFSTSALLGVNGAGGSCLGWLLREAHPSARWSEWHVWEILVPLGHCPLLPTPVSRSRTNLKACFAKKRHPALLPAFAGCLDGVSPVLLPSPHASEPALGSAGILDMDQQIFLMLCVSGCSSSFFSSPHIYHPKHPFN